MRTTNPIQIKRLMACYYRPLFHFAAQLCDSPVQALVLTQRTFRLALERSRSLPAPHNRRVWLFTILFAKYISERPRPHHS